MKGLTKILYMLLALIVSVLLWVYVVGIERPEKEDVITGIPVTFVGEQELRDDYSLIITSNKRPTVSLTVRGSIMDIAALNTSKDSISVKASLTHINSAGVKSITYEVTLPRGTDVTLMDQSPYYIEVTFEKIYTRAVDIVFKNEGSLEQGYLVKTPELNPASLQVTGPKSSADRIAYAEVVWTRQNLNQTLTLDLDYKFYDSDGKQIIADDITANFETIAVTLPVQKTRDVPLTIEILPGGGATESDIEKTFDPAYITIAGEPSVVDSINSIQVGTIRLAEVYGTGGSKEYDILLPDGVENLSGETDCAVTITIIDLKIRALTCENISLINKPEDKEIELITNRIAITIRGKEQELEAITAANLRVVADLSTVELIPGRISVPVTVFIDGTTSVGVVGSYSIAVELLIE